MMEAERSLKTGEKYTKRWDSPIASDHYTGSEHPLHRQTGHSAFKKKGARAQVPPGNQHFRSLIQGEMNRIHL